MRINMRDNDVLWCLVRLTSLQTALFVYHGHGKRKSYFYLLPGYL